MHFHESISVTRVSQKAEKGYVATHPYFTPYYMLVSPDRHLILDSLSLNARWHNLPNLVVSLCKKYSKLGYQKLTLSQINFISP